MDPKISFSTGYDVSKSSKYLYGILQGFPASPVLFDFYINDVFKDIIGVEVPDLNKKNPGLLLADYVDLLATSKENLQKSSETINAWSDT
ncbi:hypothetical protein AYI68_g4738 [Smittium mucronatum]|uniref:Reverse transcriptase domain-containing protein n=1 Tax=Smittium mucronatum TaxID=133383 RepID=A0A1R0GWE0_9FUNG|nr:hypothetical protein AYI68_g4738 [Smittium mucronatum]